MCGIFAISDNKDASRLAYVGLFTLQHRGQESAGIVTDDNGLLRHSLGMGLVSEIFTKDALETLKGRSAIGHVRYSTTGSSHIKNAQPLVLDSYLGQVAVAHNGNLTNSDGLKEQLQKGGAIFQSTSDTEVILHLMAKHRGSSLSDTLAKNLPKLEGSYAFAFLAPGKGTIRMVDAASGETLLAQQVEAGDIFRMCQTKDAPVRDWPGAPGCRRGARFLIDETSLRPARDNYPLFESRGECLRWIMTHRIELVRTAPDTEVAPVDLARWLLGLAG